MARPHHLLFVCSGNICRSPIAEYLARAYASRTNVEVQALSAGTLGLVDRPADPKMVAVAKEIGLDLSPHVCQPLTRELVEWADHVLVMEFNHVGFVADLGGDAKTQLLGRQVGVDEIDDPIGAWTKWRFRTCRNQLKTAVERFVDTLPSEVEE